MYNSRVIVPAALRQEVLEGLHAAHQGVGKMHDRSMQAVYWPGLYKELEGRRNRCEACDKTAPSQSAMPPLPIQSPEYPFQMLVADYCTIKGKSWLIMADRFTGWVSVYYFCKEATAQDLIEILKIYFTTFGVAEHISSDDGSQFRSRIFANFLQRWGVDIHRVSSDYFPHSNLRAETAVKTAKRLLMTNTKSDGSPIWDRVSRALMAHRNTPVNDINFSPAQLLFGRPIRDFLPIRPGSFKPSDVWVDCAEKRELALRHRLSLGTERWSKSTKELPALVPGQQVYIQNQRGMGKIAKRWDRTGVVLENKGYDKYSVKVDGSGRVTNRNRRFIRGFKPDSGTLRGPRPTTPTLQPTPDHTDILPRQRQALHQAPASLYDRDLETHSYSEPDTINMPDDDVQYHAQEQAEHHPALPQDNSQVVPKASYDATPTVTSPQPTTTLPTPPRQSGRVRQPNKLYPAKDYDLTRD